MAPDDIDDSSEPRPDARSGELFADLGEESTDDLVVDLPEESGELVDPEGDTEADAGTEADAESTPQQSSGDLLAQMSGGDLDDDDLDVSPVFRRERPRVLKGWFGRARAEALPVAERAPDAPTGGYRVRRVRRLVRHIEPWSVLKVCLVFYLCVWGLLVIATRMLWSAADEAGTIGKVESFIEELFALESFTFDSAQIFRIFVLGGLVLVVGGIGVTVVLVVLFNLISDLTGGIRFTMVEEETAVRQRKLRRGDVVVETPVTGTSWQTEGGPGE